MAMDDEYDSGFSDDSDVTFISFLAISFVHFNKKFNFNQLA